MATTNFVDGTVIEADWLNDVDAKTYENTSRAWGRVTNSGSAALVQGNNITSVSRTALGTVLVTFTSNPVDANYAVIVTPHSGNNILATVNLINAGNFTVLTYTANTGAAVDANFMFDVIR